MNDPFPWVENGPGQVGVYIEDELWGWDREEPAPSTG